MPKWKRIDVAAAADKYINVPFRHKGRSRKGVDCLGLLILVGHDIGYLDKANITYDYSEQPDGLFLREELHKFFDYITAKQAGVGDIALMLGTNRDIGIHSCHLGILTTNGCMIHAYSDAQRVIRTRFNPKWRRLTRGYFRIRDSY